MNFLALLPIFTTLIDRIFPDKEKAAEAAAKMQEALNQLEAKRLEAEAIENQSKKEIIVAELNTGWAGNWRAYLMMVCISIVAYNWIVVSFLNAFLAPLGMPITAVIVPTELWTLVTVGLGGYIGKETIKTYSDGKVEKARIENPPNDKAFYDLLRSKVFTSGMTQEQVDALKEALRARDGA